MSDSADASPAATPRPRGRPHKVRRWSTIERDVREEFGPLLAGIDEVGRGPLAGPVVACAVIMPPDARAIRGVDDSKQLTRLARERLARLIRARALAVGLGAASAREIDRLNVFQATVLAMRRALSRLTVTPNHVLVDGNPLRTLGVPHRAVVGGDARCYSVACASIVAKVTRDRVMRALGVRHPEYMWTQNVGYATAAHLAGIDRHGISPHHRRRFWSVAQTMLALDGPAAALTDAELTAVAETLDDGCEPDTTGGDVQVLDWPAVTADVADNMTATDAHRLDAADGSMNSASSPETGSRA